MLFHLAHRQRAIASADRHRDGAMLYGRSSQRSGVAACEHAHHPPLLPQNGIDDINEKRIMGGDSNRVMELIITLDEAVYIAMPCGALIPREDLIERADFAQK